MRNLYHSLLLIIAGSTQKQLAQQVRYLSLENQMMRGRLPKRVGLNPQEKNRLIRFGSRLGKAMDELVRSVHPQTLRTWIREAKQGKQPLPAKPGRKRKSEQLCQLVIRFAQENGWGYTRILGELKKLGIPSIARNTVKNILLRNGFDPGPKRGPGTWDEFLKIHAATLWQCDFFSKKVLTPKGLAICLS